MTERASRWASAALIAGGATWTVSWFMSALGDGSVLGLDEGGWRALLNPALVLLGLGAWIFYLRLGSAAAGLGLLATAILELGLLWMLVANLLEFGLTGGRHGDDAGFAAAALLTIAALLLLGVAIVRTGAVRREASMPFAGGIAAFVLGTLAIPVFGVGWLLWGYVLLAAARDPMRPPGERR